MAEKRNYFRVNQDLLLDYRSVDAYTANSEDPNQLFAEETPTQLFEAFRGIDLQAQEIARSIGDSDRPILKYIQCLQHKVDLLARELVSNKVPDTCRKTPVNLSEGGLAFLSDKAIYKGSFIVVRMVFLPSYAGVILFAEITRCETVKGDKHHIAAKFHRTSETQQQVLAKAILDTQLTTKRQERANKPELD